MVGIGRAPSPRRNPIYRSPPASAWRSLGNRGAARRPSCAPASGCSRRGARRRRLDPLRRSRNVGIRRRGDPRRPRRGDRPHPAGAGGRPPSDPPRRIPSIRNVGDPLVSRAAARRARGARGARGGGAPQCQRSPRRGAAPALGWDAPAGRDRGGARRAAAARARRRAHDRARRHDPRVGLRPPSTASGARRKWPFCWCPTTGARWSGAPRASCASSGGASPAEPMEPTGGSLVFEARDLRRAFGGGGGPRPRRRFVGVAARRVGGARRRIGRQEVDPRAGRSPASWSPTREDAGFGARGSLADPVPRARGRGASLRPPRDPARVPGSRHLARSQLSRGRLRRGGAGRRAASPPRPTARARGARVALARGPRRRARGAIPKNALGRGAAAGRDRARARPRSPAVLVLDEATSALDASTRDAVVSLVARLPEGGWDSPRSGSPRPRRRGGGVRSNLGVVLLGRIVEELSARVACRRRRAPPCPVVAFSEGRAPISNDLLRPQHCAARHPAPPADARAIPRGAGSPRLPRGRDAPLLGRGSAPRVKRPATRAGASPARSSCATCR